MPLERVRRLTIILRKRQNPVYRSPSEPCRSPRTTSSDFYNAKPLMQDTLVDPDEAERGFTWKGALVCILFGWLVKILRNRVREHMKKTGALRGPKIYKVR